MSSSTLPPLSLLAKGIGQTVSNGHEKLEVYLEPKDYYNLKSGSFGKFASIQQRKNDHYHMREEELRPANIHKTFVTRKGALLIFSEELANKALKEEAKELYVKPPVKVSEKSELKLEGNKYQEEQNEEDPLRTVHDLRVAILMYGSQPEYRKKGNDLYLRFVHNARAPHDERFIRPGFSPNRYMSAWSRLWHQEMLKKLQEEGLVHSSSLQRKDPLLPQFYHHDWHNLSTIPPPYRVTRNMLHAWDGSSHDYQRTRKMKGVSNIKFEDEKLSKGLRHGAQHKHDGPQEGIPIKSIQAVRFLESGEVEEVKYSELKQHEKQEILTELLATAWEHGKHIEQMLDLVLSSNKPRSSSAASSSAESELMMDMHKAILSLAESPVQRQIRDKQMRLEKQKQAKLKAKEEKLKRDHRKSRKHTDHERETEERKEKRRKDLNVEAHTAVVQEKSQVPLEKQISKDSVEEREQRRAARAARHQERDRLRKEKEKEREMRKERELQKEKEREKRRAERRLERERRAEEKREAQRQAYEKARLEEENNKRKHDRHETADDNEEFTKESADNNLRVERKTKEARREETRKKQREREQQYTEDDFETQHRDEKTQENFASLSHPRPPVVRVEKREAKRAKVIRSHQAPTSPVENVEIIYDERIGDYADRDSHKSYSDTYSDGAPVTTTQTKGYTPKSRPMPQVPQNTPATEPRTNNRLQRQLPLENVIYEAKSKRSYTSSNTSYNSSKKVKPVYHTPTVISSGDGQFATYIEPKKKAVKVKPTRHEQPGSLLPEPIIPDKESSHVSSRKSSLVFSISIPGRSQPSVGKSSFYGGAMPISSNIVKQTLSDKISILSASQDYSATSEHVYEIGSSGRNEPALSQTEQLQVPGVGYEESSITQQSSTTTKKSQSITISSKTTSEVKRKNKVVEFSESEDEQMDSTSQLTYPVLKGSKGPGSQSSAAFSKGESKKSTTISRGNVPHELLDQKHAAIFMPDKKIVDVRALPPQSSYDDSSSSTAKEEQSSLETEQQKSTESSQTKSSISERPTKPDAKVTFENPLTEVSENEISEYETDTAESEKSEAGWPPVDTSARPISSRSAKLTDHAQKVAEIVVMTQRPDSKLEEDAARAAELWNKISKSEEGSTEDTESYETSVDEDAGSSQWNTAGIVEALDKNSVKSSIKKGGSVDYKKSKASSVKSDAVSVKSSKTGSSRKTSVSSVQEAFIKEVKRKASELGINENELQFEPDLVSKVYSSTVDPNEVEVFHDLDEGKHVVRSRHSSITAKSQHTDMSTSSDTKRRQFVVDVPQDKSSPRPETASTESSTVSAASSRLRKLSQSSSSHSRQTKSSIPVSMEDVALNYGLTSYEKKPQSEAKHEAPKSVTKEKKIEPAKLVHIGKEKKSSKVAPTKEDSRKKSEKKQQPLVTSSGNEEKTAEINSSKPDNAKFEAKKLEEEKSLDSKSMKKMRIKKGKDKQKKDASNTEDVVNVPTASPVKQKTKSPEVPFTAGRAKDDKVPKGLQPPQQPVSPVKPKKETVPSPKQVNKKPKSKKKKEADEPKKPPSPPPQVQEEVEKAKTPVPEPVEEKSASPEMEDDHLSSIPSVSPEDDYDFVRVEESPEPSEPEVVDQPLDDVKSLASEKTAPTEDTAETDNSEELLRAAEEEEAKLAKKKEKEERRLAAAEKRRLDVERKRKDKEEQLKREKEEQERQDAMKEELEREQHRRVEEMKKRREEAEQSRLREQQEEELRKKREEQQLERERRMQEEHKKRLEELQRRKREDELRKAEEARLKAEEEREALEREKEMLAQMAEDEVLEYERRKREEMEEKKRLEEERKRFEEEEARIMMEQARLQAIIKAKQQAALEEKLKFIRSFQIEANGLDETQRLSRSFHFSYFELLKLLGLQFSDLDLDE